MDEQQQQQHQQWRWKDPVWVKVSAEHAHTLAQKTFISSKIVLRALNICHFIFFVCVHTSSSVHPFVRSFVRWKTWQRERNYFLHHWSHFDIFSMISFQVKFSFVVSFDGLCVCVSFWCKICFCFRWQCVSIKYPLNLPNNVNTT